MNLKIWYVGIISIIIIIMGTIIMGIICTEAQRGQFSGDLFIEVRSSVFLTWELMEKKFCQDNYFLIFLSICENQKKKKKKN